MSGHFLLPLLQIEQGLLTLFTLISEKDWDGGNAITPPALPSQVNNHSGMVGEGSQMEQDGAFATTASSSACLTNGTEACWEFCFEAAAESGLEKEVAARRHWGACMHFF